MPGHDDRGAAGSPDGSEEPEDGPDGVPDGAGTRDHRIEQLRAELERLQARVAEDMARQRRAAMKLQALLDEERHLARRARRQGRSARLRQDTPDTPGVSDTPDTPDTSDTPGGDGSRGDAGG